MDNFLADASADLPTSSIAEDADVAVPVIPDILNPPRGTSLDIALSAELPILRIASDAFPTIGILDRSP
jgi:hypothetical protein